MGKPAELSLKEKIDSDKGLKTKRTILTTVSLVLLAIIFAGASIKEANTFIFLIEFKHATGLSILIAVAIVFLFIRYYSYARQYHQYLTNLWKNDLTNEDLFCVYDEQEGIPYGVMYEKAPDELVHRQYHQNIEWTSSYESCGLFCRYFLYTEFDNNVGEVTEEKRVFLLKEFGLLIYLRVLMLEIKNQVLGLGKYPENLDLLAPYLISFLSLFLFVASLAFPNELANFFSYFMGE